MGKKGTRGEKPGKRGDMPPTIAKRYKLARSVMKSIKDVAPEYGSLGRALQVATELLIRLPKPIKIPPTLAEEEVVGKTYKLAPRTIELIEQLSNNHYGKRGNVLAACVEILKPPS
jgi:hypothetical protein